MAIKKETKTVYTCSDGTCFDNENKAKDYEFDDWYGNITDSLQPPIGPEIDPSVLRRWLAHNRNRVLDYLGTEYDPEEAKAEK